ncbi:hypothetical protein UlMin_003791 [Ulmus minor]
MATMISASSSSTLFKSKNTDYPKSTVHLTCRRNHNRWIRNKSLTTRKVADINDFSAAVDAAPVNITWEIVVGAIAGVTPFVVAGIEFSKRIIAQKTCEICGGSGLVLKKENYVRCPGCGGFLPWQSWRIFFSG